LTLDSDRNANRKSVIRLLMRYFFRF